MSGEDNVTTTVETPVLEMYRSYFTPTDESIPYRLVGSYEYLNALDQFTKLINLSTTEELKVYDKIVRDRAEFAFIQGAQLAFNQFPDLTKASRFERQRFEDEFVKKGLPWMMALARVELGATSSLYGKVEHPFEAVMPTPFEAEAYLTIMKDDVFAHMKSLAQEPGFKEVLRRSRKPDTWTLAYLRRIKLIRDLLHSLARAGGESVAAEIEPLTYELKKHKRNLVDQVMSETVNNQSTGVATKTSTRTQLRISRTRGRCQEFVNDNFGTGADGVGSSSASSASASGGGSRNLRSGPG